MVHAAHCSAPVFDWFALCFLRKHAWMFILCHWIFHCNFHIVWYCGSKGICKNTMWTALTVKCHQSQSTNSTTLSLLSLRTSFICFPWAPIPFWPSGLRSGPRFKIWSRGADLNCLSAFDVKIHHFRFKISLVSIICSPVHGLRKVFKWRWKIASKVSWIFPRVIARAVGCSYDNFGIRLAHPINFIHER